MTWKNKRIFWIACFLLVTGIGIRTISKYTNDMPEDRKQSSGTSVLETEVESIDNYANVLNYRYTLEKQLLSKQHYRQLKDMSFSFLEEIQLSGVCEEQEEKWLEQNPQGLCFADRYLFLTSYSDKEDCFGNFIIFDRNSGEYLITLAMDEKSHLGGIAFDGENVWICNSYTNAIERISYAFIEQLIYRHSGEIVNITNLVDVYPVENTPSCITCYENRIWIATHNKWSDSSMGAYAYDSTKDIVQKQETYIIPPRVQGVTFGSNGEIYFSISYGRKNSSYIKKYESLEELNTDVENYTDIIEMPPCSEELIYWKNCLYILFESAGEKFYSGTDGNGICLSPLDKILVIYLN